MLTADEEIRGDLPYEEPVSGLELPGLQSELAGEVGVALALRICVLLLLLLLLLLSLFHHHFLPLTPMNPRIQTPPKTLPKATVTKASVEPWLAGTLPTPATPAAGGTSRECAGGPDLCLQDRDLCTSATVI